MRSLLSYFGQAVQALGWHKTAEPASVAAPARAEPARVRAVAAPAPKPVFHDEKFMRALLGALHQSSPRVKTTYDTWLYYSAPDEEKRAAHYSKVLEQQEARRAAPLRDDERKSLRHATDHSFSIKAHGAKMEFVHQLQSFLLSLHVEGSRSLPRQNPGYLRQEFSFKPLPDTKENAAMIQEVRASYRTLRHEIEGKADDLLRLMNGVVCPAKAPLAIAMEQIAVSGSTDAEAPVTSAMPAGSAEHLPILFLPAPAPPPAVRAL